MNNICVFGAGKSSTVATEYLANLAAKQSWILTICDQNTQHLLAKFGSNPNVNCIDLDVNDNNARRSQIEKAAIVISLMPPNLHHLIAVDCVNLRKHLITASYVSDAMRALDAEAKEAGVMLMCELGLDPGIDHMSAMEIIDDLHAKGATINKFYSHCGGLVAPESDTNPWHYKISWNPRNVVTAGAAGANYLENGVMKHVPYEKIFAQQQLVQIPKLGTLAYYPNRDSVGYKDDYKLNEVNTLVRTTLRYPEFISAWQYLINYGFTKTDDNIATYSTLKQWAQAKLGAEVWPATISVDDKKLLDALELFTDTPISTKASSSADILQSVIEEKWQMQQNDKDMIVMLHEFYYTLNNKNYKLECSLVVKGKDKVHTAMATTVGMPMALLAEALLSGTIKPAPGVHIPIDAQFYKPLLAQLKNHNITFIHNEYEI